MVTIEAVPPRPNPRPDDPALDVPALRDRWQYIVRHARTWPVPKPETIREAVNKLKDSIAGRAAPRKTSLPAVLEPDAQPGPSAVVLVDVTDAGRLMADALRLGAVMVLESALGMAQLKDTDDEVLRMAAVEGPGALRAVAADGRLILADIPLAEELRSRIFRPAEERQGLERSLALGLWWLCRTTGDAVRQPDAPPADIDPPGTGLMGRIHEVMGRGWVG